VSAYDELLDRAKKDLHLLQVGGYEHTSTLVADLIEAVEHQASELAITRVALADARRERDELASSTTAGRDTATARKENPDE
jgi:3-dehydroquinate dehydratase